MKYQRMSMTIGVMVAAVATMVSTVKATVLFYEGFDYTASSTLLGNNGGVGFSSPWATNNTSWLTNRASLGNAWLNPGNRSTEGKFTYVIVHGAWGGGWAFREVERLLRADGHTVFRPTLTGQGEKVHLAGLLTTNIDLALHITDVENVIRWEDLHDIVLVGHSYGGMVITGVADRVPDRIKHIIYLDAIVPEAGESANTALGNASRETTNAFIAPFWIKGNEPIPHDVPHPARTFSQPLTLKNQVVAQKIPTTYILTVDPGQEPQRDMFYKSSERAKARHWTTLVMEGDHNVQWTKPKELVELLEKAP